MAKLDKNKVGLVVGVFCALLHAVWALIVLIGVGQKILDWVLPLHFIDNLYSVTAFSITNALILVIAAFIGGYIMGWVYSALWNCLNKK